MRHGEITLNSGAVSDRMGPTDDQRIRSVRPLPTPEELIHGRPIVGTDVETLVASSRQRIRDIISGVDRRLLVIIGPCSIHDSAAALEYAHLLKEQRDKHVENLEVVMRVYFEKPRTTVGWKGFINDPALDQTFQMEYGLRTGRDLLVEINRIGLPAGCEFLDVISPQYFGDLISWGAIGARTTESQVHRELASGLSAPIGFKNGTDGNTRIVCDAIRAAAMSHQFLSVTKTGRVAIVETAGNADCHTILRGGRETNYDPQSIERMCSELEAANLVGRVMVDCSHGNSKKRYEQQIVVAQELARQVRGGSRRILGAMVESHLKEGAQSFLPGKDSPRELTYGMSITDACLGWAQSVDLLNQLSEAANTGLFPAVAH